MIQDKVPYTSKGVVLAAALFATGAMRSILYHNFMYWSNLAGMHMRSIICAVVYRKVSEMTVLFAYAHFELVF